MRIISCVRLTVLCVTLFSLFNANRVSCCALLWDMDYYHSNEKIKHEKLNFEYLHLVSINMFMD